MLAGHYERVNLLTYLHFSDSFLSDSGGRRKPLESFWSTRASLLTNNQLDAGAARPQSAPHEEKLTRDTPIIQKLEGLLQNSDMLPLIDTACVPLIFIQSTEDRLYSAMPLEALLEEKRPSSTFAVVRSPRQCLQTSQAKVPAKGNAIHVSWLKVRKISLQDQDYELVLCSFLICDLFCIMVSHQSGHEVLQERGVFLHKLLDKIITQASENRQPEVDAQGHIHPRLPWADDGQDDDVSVEDASDDGDKSHGDTATASRKHPTATTAVDGTDMVGGKEEGKGGLLSPVPAPSSQKVETAQPSLAKGKRAHSHVRID